MAECSAEGCALDSLVAAEEAMVVAYAWPLLAANAAAACDRQFKVALTSELIRAARALLRCERRDLEAASVFAAND